MSRFAIYPSSVYDDRRLTAPLIALLGLISTYADRQGWCWPSQERLAKQLGVTRQTVSENVTKLVKCGYLTIKRRPGSSLMRLIYDLEAAIPPQTPAAELSGNPDISCPENPTSDVGETRHRTIPRNIPKETPKRASRIPDDWALTPALRDWAAQKHPAVNLELEAEKFLAYWQSSSSRGAVKMDWARGFQVWVMNGATRYGTGNHSGPGNRGPVTGPRGAEATEDRRGRLAAVVAARQERHDT